MTDKKELAVTEGNKLIAEFMGEHFIEFHEMICRCDPDSGSPWGYDPIQWLTYDRDWSELMPVVEKIYNLLQSGDVQYVNVNDEENISCLTIFATREMVWNAVVEFIQWYNNQTINQ